MSDVRHICFNAEKYDDATQMFDDVARTLQILIRNGHKCSFEYDDCGIYVLRFDDEDQDIAEYELVWKKVENEGFD